MATLKDVATMAGVDASTASRVLRGDPVQSARPETRERILRAANELDYRANAMARGLRTRRTDTIGLVIPSLENVGFSDVTHGIQAAAASAGMLVLVIEAEAFSRPDSSQDLGELYARLIADGRVDGLIAAFATLDDQLVGQLAARGIPLILVNRRTAGVRGSVVVDDELGSSMAVQHLVDLGHRRIGYIGLSERTDTARRREQGFGNALAEAGLKVDRKLIVNESPTLAGGRRAVEELFAKSEAIPTALFVASLQGAIGVLAGLRGLELRVPEDVSVIAFNDHELAAHLDPPLTTVRMPNFAMGTQAVELLLNVINGRGPDDHMIGEAPRLVVRGSTRPL